MPSTGLGGYSTILIFYRTPREDQHPWSRLLFTFTAVSKAGRCVFQIPCTTVTRVPITIFCTDDYRSQDQPHWLISIHDFRSFPELFLADWQVMEFFHHLACNETLIMSCQERMTDAPWILVLCCWQGAAPVPLTSETHKTQS